MEHHFLNMFWQVFPAALQICFAVPWGPPNIYIKQTLEIFFLGSWRLEEKFNLVKENLLKVYIYIYGLYKPNIRNPHTFE